MARADKPGDTLHEGSGDFLTRWSQRKLGARRQGAGPEETGADLPQGAAEPDTAGEIVQPARELTDDDMPPLESLGSDSDYTPFLSPGVSDGLRRLALRKLFSQPAFNVTDGLNDYDEDYTQFAKLGSVITHEMQRMLKREREDRGQEEQSQDVPPAAGPQAADDALPEAEQQTGADAGDINSNDAIEGNNDPDVERDGEEDQSP